MCKSKLLCKKNVKMYTKLHITHTIFRRLYEKNSVCDYFYSN